MNARSLVGMSMSARKRAAELLVDDAMVLSLHKAMDEGRPLADPDVARREARRVYRVGQHLRPCPGCAACLKCSICGNPAACYGQYEGALHPEHHCDECCGHGGEDGWCEPIWDEDWDMQPCNGSGVLPARGAR